MAERDLGEVGRDQVRRRDQLASADDQLSAAAQANSAATEELSRHAAEPTTADARPPAQARDHQATLDPLPAAQREGGLRRDREAEQANFVLDLHRMLGRRAVPAAPAVFAADASKLFRLALARATSSDVPF